MEEWRAAQGVRGARTECGGGGAEDEGHERHCEGFLAEHDGVREL